MGTPASPQARVLATNDESRIYTSGRRVYRSMIFELMHISPVRTPAFTCQLSANTFTSRAPMDRCSKPRTPKEKSAFRKTRLFGEAALASGIHACGKQTTIFN